MKPPSQLTILLILLIGVSLTNSISPPNCLLTEDIMGNSVGSEQCVSCIPGYSLVRIRDIMGNEDFIMGCAVSIVPNCFNYFPQNGEVDNNGNIAVNCA